MGVSEPSEVLLGVFTSGLTQQYIIRGSGERQLATLKRYLWLGPPKTWVI